MLVLVLVLLQGEAGSMMRASDVIRVKPACQLPTDVLKAAQSFQRYSPAYPPNSLRLVPKFCFTAAISTPDPQPHCFTDALQFDSFSLLTAYNDPDKGSQYPGYVLYQENTTRVCQATISRDCLEQSGGDDELCMAMLVAASGIIGQPSRQAAASSGSFRWSPGTAAAVAVAGEGAGCAGAGFVLAAQLRCLPRSDSTACPMLSSPGCCRAPQTKQQRTLD